MIGEKNETMEDLKDAFDASMLSQLRFALFALLCFPPRAATAQKKMHMHMSCICNTTRGHRGPGRPATPPPLNASLSLCAGQPVNCIALYPYSNGG